MGKRKVNVAMLIAAGADTSLKEDKSKQKSQDGRISLNTTTIQKMQLKQKAEEAGEASLSRFIVEALKKHGYLH